MPGFTAWRVFVLRYTTVAELDLGSRVATIELNIQVGPTLLTRA